ncbi:MAG: Zn-ribbon domain-containing OB-fold protein [Candidatus Bathyarchaeota archaeon]|nr:Zn-ribbon domain-containing OB-fold protein [Candidatus Bathyarchaeota archaeon]
MSATEQFTIEQFYKFLQEQKLMAGKCLKCGKIHLPPRPICDNCLGREFEWMQISGKGKLLTYTVINVAPAQFQSMAPYVVGIVEFGIGLKIPGIIQGVTQEQLEIGMELALDFGACSTPQTWPQWQRYCFKAVAEKQ